MKIETDKNGTYSTKTSIVFINYIIGKKSN